MTVLKHYCMYVLTYSSWHQGRAQGIQSEPHFLPPADKSQTAIKQEWVRFLDFVSVINNLDGNSSTIWCFFAGVKTRIFFELSGNEDLKLFYSPKKVSVLKAT